MTAENLRLNTETYDTRVDTRAAVAISTYSRHLSTVRTYVSVAITARRLEFLTLRLHEFEKYLIVIFLKSIAIMVRLVMIFKIQVQFTVHILNKFRSIDIKDD